MRRITALLSFCFLTALLSINAAICLPYRTVALVLSIRLSVVSAILFWTTLKHILSKLAQMKQIHIDNEKEKAQTYFESLELLREKADICNQLLDKVSEKNLEFQETLVAEIARINDRLILADGRSVSECMNNIANTLTDFQEQSRTNAQTISKKIRNNGEEISEGIDTLGEQLQEWTQTIQAQITQYQELTSQDAEQLQALLGDSNEK